MFKFTLTIATSAFLFMSGTADLFAMDPPPLGDGDSKSGRQLVRLTKPCPAPLHNLETDLQELIFNELLKDNPRSLLRISGAWYRFMREDNVPQDAELHYSSMNLFMKECMNTFWKHQFYNGILRYTPINGGQAGTYKFADLNKEGTFDLSACGNTGQHIVITQSMGRFFKSKGENAEKTVILITPRYLVEQEIITQKVQNQTPIYLLLQQVLHPDVAKKCMSFYDRLNSAHPFAHLMVGWDADKAPFGIFWRWGNDKNLTCDYLTTDSASMISSCNLLENWQKSVIATRAGQVFAWVPHTIGGTRSISCQFLNLNKN